MAKGRRRHRCGPAAARRGARRRAIPDVGRRATARLPAGGRGRAPCSSRWRSSARDHGIVNVCSGRPVSVRSLVEGWIRDNGWSIELELGRYPVSGPRADGVLGRRSQAAGLNAPSAAHERADRKPTRPADGDLPRRAAAGAAEPHVPSAEQAARDMRRSGDVVLVQSLQTGLVFNHAFRPELMRLRRRLPERAGPEPCVPAAPAGRGRHRRPPLQGRSLIEVGCGKGLFLEQLRAAGFDITGLDPTYEGSNPRVIKRVLHAAHGTARRRHHPAPRAGARAGPVRVSRRTARSQRRQGPDLHRGAVPRLDRAAPCLVRHLLRARQLLPAGRLRSACSARVHRVRPHLRGASTSTSSPTWPRCARRAAGRATSSSCRPASWPASTTAARRLHGAAAPVRGGGRRLGRRVERRDLRLLHEPRRRRARHRDRHQPGQAGPVPAGHRHAGAARPRRRCRACPTAPTCS